jgi:MoaA/NifB/PqqE/SkfB family radical SAM enzyme
MGLAKNSRIKKLNATCAKEKNEKLMLQFDYLTTFSAIQVELSTVCNSLCLGCVRTSENFNEIKGKIPKNKFLDAQKFVEIFNSCNGKKIRRVEFCGNIDEPLAHPEFIKILEELYAINPQLVIQIHTNGGLRSTDYHHKMAEIHRKFDRRSCIRYGIDGIYETHSFYRQNTDFNKAMNNMKAAIAGGSRVIWQFLIFPWNDHQVSDARAIAEKIGCAEFWLRPDRSGVSILGREGVMNKKAELFVPARKNTTFELPVRKQGEEIICRFLRNNEGTLFLSWEGKVWPCCFHANVFYESDEKISTFKDSILKGYEEDFNDLKKFSFDEILEHQFFRDNLMRSWSNSGDERAWRCVEKCRSTRVRASDQKLDHENEYGLIKQITSGG